MILWWYYNNKVNKALTISLAELAGCEVENLPISYLGLPLGANPRSLSFRDPIVEKVIRRLDGCKRAYFSLGGRITNIQSCLSNILLYHLSLSKSLREWLRNWKGWWGFFFFWSGSGEQKRNHLVHWGIWCLKTSLCLVSCFGSFGWNLTCFGTRLSKANLDFSIGDSNKHLQPESLYGYLSGFLLFVSPR